MEQVNAVTAYTAGLLAQAQARQDLSALDAVKWDEVNYDMGLDYGVPAQFLRGPDELLAKRQQDAQAQAQAKEQAAKEQLMMQAGSKVVDNIGA